ncbi:MAG TPA: hypothetical protein VGD10_05785 [Allosphingosinicella sp.]|uniref:hypothetical protein n=1 Tax=Allosphingosinicella sp. TaxID=2823234 RepID=UPI002EDA20D8
MRKSLLPLVLGSTLALGACASPLGGLGGLGGPYDPVGAVLGSVLGGATNSGYGYGNQNFQQAAVNACGNEASRYGQVGINDVRQQSSSTLRVYGTINNNYDRRSFACSFRSDGRITDFDVD